MIKVFLFFVIFIGGCFPAHIKELPRTYWEVEKSCSEFYKGSEYKISYRNNYSYFCECSKLGRIIVIGSLGTIYE